MSYTEALAQLKAARPIVDKIRYTRFGWHTSPEEFAVLEEIQQVLQKFSYSKELLSDAGWTSLDVSFLHGRLNYYRTHEHATLKH
jgi:hypothetical protein